MIYFYPCGNLGNQLFQYAFIRNIQNNTNAKIYVNWNGVLASNLKTNWSGGEPGLEYFNVVPFSVKTRPGLCICRRIIFKLVYKKARNAPSDKLVSILEKLGIYTYGAGYYPFKLHRKGNKVVRGFFESPKYFADIDDIIKQELTPKYSPLPENKGLYEEIANSNSICVTVRRGDFFNDYNIEKFGVCSSKYYLKGVEYIQAIYPDAKVFVFSDDVNWCKEHLRFPGEVFFESGNDPVWEKLRLMYMCKHYVISNSTFSWWAQHLSRNEKKIVVAPSVWRRGDPSSMDIYEDDWICMNSDGEITAP